MSKAKILMIAAGLTAAAVTAAAVALTLHRKNRKIDDLQAMVEILNAPPPETEYYEKQVDVNHHYDLSGQKILLSDETFGEIWIPVLEDVTRSQHPNERLKQEGERMYSYDENGNRNAVTGIDISSHNNVTDWNAVKNDGIEFVMLRAGYRTYGGGILHEDDKFKSYYKGAKAAGLKVGAYFFSQAVTEEEAIEEARLTGQVLKGCELDYPVVFDWEIIYDDDGARTDHVPVDSLTDLTLAFCQHIQEFGFQPMIYQGKRCALFKYDLPRLKGIPFWLAEYGDGPTYIYDYDMWQYSCKGTVAGVEDKVDMDLCFYDYSKEGNPPFSVTPPADTQQTSDESSSADESSAGDESSSDESGADESSAESGAESSSADSGADASSAEQSEGT